MRCSLMRSMHSVLSIHGLFLLTRWSGIPTMPTWQAHYTTFDHMFQEKLHQVLLDLVKVCAPINPAIGKIDCSVSDWTSTRGIWGRLLLCRLMKIVILSFLIQYLDTWYLHDQNTSVKFMRIWLTVILVDILNVYQALIVVTSYSCWQYRNRLFLILIVNLI